MTRFRSVFWLSAFLCASASAQTVGDFALLDHEGTFHQLSYYGDQQAVVIVAHANGDAVAAELAGVRAASDADDVVWFMLNAMPEETRQTVAHAAENDLPILVDETQLVARDLGLSQVGEAIVINPADREVMYRGNIEGIIAALEGSDPGVTTVAGTEIPYLSEPAASYVNDIVPILQDNCVSCHHDGAIAPWSMSSHAMVQGWSTMMKEVVMNRRMPPGQIDTHVGRPIQNVAGLTVDEQQKLISWIDAGAPRDGETDPLTKLKFANPKFTYGEPDLIVDVPPQTIPATGVIDYRYIPVELNLDRDVWVEAMEFVPGDRAVLHHVIAYLSSPADKTLRGRQTGADRGESIAGFAPGRGADIFRDNSGRLIRKGSNLLLQMHYTTSGKETVDATQVGIYLHDKPPQHVMSGGVAGQRRFLVPPFEKEYKIEGEQLIEREAYLYSMTPHMHYRGKYMSYVAEYPNGESEILLSVPKYDFNWQFAYELEEPAFLPAGTRLVARGAMDNSDRNPANPNPELPVHFGLQTKHEMFFGFTTLRYVGDSPANIASSESGEPGVAGGQ